MGQQQKVLKNGAAGKNGVRDSTTTKGDTTTTKGDTTTPKRDTTKPVSNTMPCVENTVNTTTEPVHTTREPVDSKQGTVRRKGLMKLMTGHEACYKVIKLDFI